MSPIFKTPDAMAAKEVYTALMFELKRRGGRNALAALYAPNVTVQSSFATGRTMVGVDVLLARLEPLRTDLFDFYLSVNHTCGPPNIFVYIIPRGQDETSGPEGTTK